MHFVCVFLLHGIVNNVWKMWMHAFVFCTFDFEFMQPLTKATGFIVHLYSHQTTILKLTQNTLKTKMCIHLMVIMTY